MFLSKRKLIIHTLSSSASLSVCLRPFGCFDKTYYTEEASRKRNYGDKGILPTRIPFKFIHFPQSSLWSMGNQLLSLPARVLPNLEVIGKA